MKRLAILNCSAALLALCLAPLPASANTVRIYITNAAGDSIHVIDPVTNKVVQEIKNFVGAHGIDFSPDGSKVYVTNEETETLDVLDRKSGKVIKKVQLSGHPNIVAVAKNGKIVVAIARGKGGLDVIDGDTLTLKKTIPAGRLHDVYITPDQKYVVGGSIPGKTFYAFDLEKEELAWDLKMDLGVRCMAIETNPDGSTKRVFVQMSNLNGFSVVDFAEHKETTKVPLPEPPSAYDEGGYRMGEPSHGIGIGDNKTLWVTSIPNNAVYAYDLASLKISGKVDLPAGPKTQGHDTPISAVPEWVTFTPDGKYLYVSNAALNSVSVIDTQAMKRIKVVPVGEVPKRSNTLVIPDAGHGGHVNATTPGKRADLH